MNKKPITSLALYKSSKHKKKDETYPIKLRLTLNKKRYYYSINNLSVTEHDWNEHINKTKASGTKELKKIYKDAHDFKHDADQYIKEVHSFSIDDFKDEFINGGVKKENDVLIYFDAYIEKLKKENRLSTAETYQYSKNSLKKFHPHKSLPFENITVKFLERYESKSVSEGKSLTTVGIDLRNLRSIVNQAIQDGINIKYPFGKGKFVIKSPVNRKMALTTSELKAIFNWKRSENKVKNFYYDLWKFSYLANGMNIKDICYLKNNNINKDKIIFNREKTKRTNTRPEPIIIPIIPDLRKIIDTWGQITENKNDYLFPLLNQKMTETEKRLKIKRVTRQVNKYIQDVGEELEIDTKISTYTARHSYATHLMRHGISVEYISKQLGHKNIKTTNDYLDSFEDKQIQENQNKLTDFN